MYEIVGLRAIKTKKGDMAYIVSYVKEMRGEGYGVEAGEQFVSAEMFDKAFAGVSSDKVVGRKVMFVYQRGSTFLDDMSVLPVPSGK